MTTITCEAVLTESCFLLGFAPRAMRLMRAYRNVPMSLADACLVRMSELFPDVPVFTLNKDFRVYRRNGRERIETILPH